MKKPKKRKKLSLARRRRMILFHGHMLLGLFMFILAGGFIAVIVAVNFAAPLLLVKAKHSFLSRRLAIESAHDTEKISDCVSSESDDLLVGGIFGYTVPRLPHAYRVLYGESGASAYVTDAQDTEVAIFYGQELSQHCWQLVSEDFGRSVWEKDGQSLALTITENPYGGRTRVAYAVQGGSVLAAVLEPEAAPAATAASTKPLMKIFTIDQSRLAQMQQQLARFEKSFQAMDTAVQKNAGSLSKKGVGIPEELRAALKNYAPLIQQIRAAKTPADLESLVTDIDDMGETLKTWGPKFGTLTRLGDLIKKAEGSNATQRKALTRIQAAAKKNPALAALVGELNILSGAMNEAYLNARAQAQVDPSAAENLLMSGFYDRMEEFWNRVAEADTLVNPALGLRQVQGEIQRSDAKVKALDTAKKIDPGVITELKSLLVQIKAARAELQNLVTTQADAVVTYDQAKKLWRLVRDFENLLAEQGQGSYRPKVTEGTSVTVDIPPAFEFDQPMGTDPVTDPTETTL